MWKKHNIMTSYSFSQLSKHHLNTKLFWKNRKRFSEGWENEHNNLTKYSLSKLPFLSFSLFPFLSSLFFLSSFCVCHSVFYYYIFLKFRHYFCIFHSSIVQFYFKNDINSSSTSFHFSSSKPLVKQENEANAETFACNVKWSNKCLPLREIFQYHQNKSNNQASFCGWELLLVLIFRIGFQITFKYTCLIKITKLIWLFYTH